MDHQKKMMHHFITFAFGGPNQYSGRTMRNAHKKQVEQGLQEKHFDQVLGHLTATLQELGVANDLITEAVKTTNSVRADVLGQ